MQGYSDLNAQNIQLLQLQQEYERLSRLENGSAMKFEDVGELEPNYQDVKMQDIDDGFSLEEDGLVREDGEGKGLYQSSFLS